MLHAVDIIVMLRLTIALLINATLLREHYFLHLLDRYGTFDIDPFILNHVLQFQFKDQIYTADIPVSDETEPSWLISSLVLQNDAVLNLAKVGKVGLEA